MQACLKNESPRRVLKCAFQLCSVTQQTSSKLRGFRQPSIAASVALWLDWAQLACPSLEFLMHLHSMGLRLASSQVMTSQGVQDGACMWLAVGAGHQLGDMLAAQTGHGSAFSWHRDQVLRADVPKGSTPRVPCGSQKAPVTQLWKAGTSLLQHSMSQIVNGQSSFKALALPSDGQSSLQIQRGRIRGTSLETITLSTRGEGCSHPDSVSPQLRGDVGEKPFLYRPLLNCIPTLTCLTAHH